MVRVATLLPLLLLALLGLARADYLDGWASLAAGDAEAARSSWIRAANAGDVDLQFNIGLLHESGLLGAIDHGAAIAWYRAAAGRGLAAAQTRLARMYAEGLGVQQDTELALDLLRKAAESGYGPAQFNLALVHEQGLGRAPDPEAATLWYQRAAAQGVPRAQYALARLAMRDGAGDVARAVALYRAAADAGLPEAANNLGLLYERGLGVPRDLDRAAAWYRRAADRGLAVAQNNLGQLLQYGGGIARNPVAAAVFYKQAAYGGDPFGQTNYASALANGIGVEADHVESYAWILLARTGEDPEAAAVAAEYGRRLLPQLDPERHRAAIDRARLLLEDVGMEMQRRNALRLQPLPTEDMGAPVVTAQRYLKLLGYLSGAVDGIAGPGTVAAAARFQASVGLEPDGRIGQPLIEALVAAVKAPPEAEEDTVDAED